MTPRLDRATLAATAAVCAAGAASVVTSGSTSAPLLCSSSSILGSAGPLPVDGHSPGLSGPALDAYIAAGVGSDHEATEAAEALEKRRKGMWVFLREGSASRNIAALAPTVIAHGPDRAALYSTPCAPRSSAQAGLSAHVPCNAGATLPPGVLSPNALIVCCPMRGTWSSCGAVTYPCWYDEDTEHDRCASHSCRLSCSC